MCLALMGGEVGSLLLRSFLSLSGDKIVGWGWVRTWETGCERPMNIQRPTGPGHPLW